MNDEPEAAHAAILKWLGDSGIQFLQLDVEPATAIISGDQAIAVARSMPGVEELPDAQVFALYGLYTSTQSAGPFTIRNRLIWLVIRSGVQWMPSGSARSTQDRVRGQCIDVIDATSGEWLRGHLRSDG